MKQLKTIAFLVAVTLLATLSSCGPTPTPITFDKTLLYGEWVEGTVHDTYLEDGTGHSWDTSEDISEEEASPFEWTLNNDQLQLLHTLWNGSVVPKTYTVTQLDSLKLVYEDSYGQVHNYLRVVFEVDPNLEPDPKP